MNKNEKITRDKVAILATAFTNIVRLEQYGDSDKGNTVAIGLHYLTLANSIVSRVMRGNNTLYELISLKGVNMYIQIGKPIKRVAISIENKSLKYEKQS